MDENETDAALRASELGSGVARASAVNHCRLGSFEKVSGVRVVHVGS